VYVLAVKQSARRVSRGAGEWVRARGRTRAFETKELARRWARELSGPNRHLWVQDANPRDGTDADGYLVAGKRRGTPYAPGQQGTLQ
jgi:hypothetical protein